MEEKNIYKVHKYNRFSLSQLQLLTSDCKLLENVTTLSMFLSHETNSNSCKEISRNNLNQKV